MRSANGHTYGLNSQAGCLFERSRNVMRQNSFARGRTSMKRKARDDGSSGDEAYCYDGRGNRVLMDGLKRMRVTSPPTSVPSSPSSCSSEDEYSATEDMMMDTNEARAEAKAVVVASKRNPAQDARPVMEYKMPMYGNEYAELPVDMSGTALVVFNPNWALAVERSPKVELVEDSVVVPASPSHDDATSSDDEHFVRFEEIHDDDDAQADAMEID
ncbi:hypothetical protein Poli38472_002919 [Pythium oligandrum]|uniref:Uncharacterized protein n=1 Tax=Pythium oligandrum TaxID=41045 RepID=A0A8K1C5L4_PYTOL|nr:hypothetical protein Poli38472_002919 [Pythium oligandrum]|eukprot:TMW56994.1 hypothetical protein Poli38472_002919 [Pythium oligandrum]